MGMLRDFSFRDYTFSDFALQDGRILVKQTGAHIPLNGEFFRDFARGASFAAEVSAISAARQARGRLGKSKKKRIRISFAPVTPYPWYAIWAVSHLADLDIVRDPAAADILFYFEDCEYTTRLPLNADGRPVLNGDCLDIRKSMVAEKFREVFGYTLDVDPLIHHGLALRKSERNGVHDGQIIPCPYFANTQGHVFQRLIDNTQDGRVYTDIRTPIVGGTIPAVYLKRRSAMARFSNDNFRVDLTTADEQFTPEEQQKIIAFARAMKLDFGGMDVLRDRKDGRIYIVDVNKTDMGPPTALPRQDKLTAMRALADSFRAFVAERLKADAPS
ncbi:MAG: hypothetical protein MRY59_08320 [Aquisalinus sp.]|nr:hypothetical protein [Aquisalinus sp.]